MIDSRERGRMRRRELSLWRVTLIYALGVVAGVQGALYLFDRYDDGVADPLSGWIALALLALGLAVVAHAFSATRSDGDDGSR